MGGRIHHLSLNGEMSYTTRKIDLTMDCGCQISKCSHIYGEQITRSHLQQMHHSVFKKPVRKSNDANDCYQKHFSSPRKVMLSTSKTPSIPLTTPTSNVSTCSSDISLENLLLIYPFAIHDYT